MKVIGLFPMREEQWILPTTMASMKQYVDTMIALDGSADSKSRQIVEQHGGTVIDQADPHIDYSNWRQRLLDAGRAAGGTHFVWLDADEAFTQSLLPGFRERLSAMKPGETLILDWICLWKSVDQMISSGSVLARIPKDFIVCDDGLSHFKKGKLHEGRTPGRADPSLIKRVDFKQGGVLHFQAVPFQRFQIKQAFQRCREWVLKTGKSWDINHRYGVTLDDPSILCEPVPAPWLQGMTGLTHLSEAAPGWFYQDILTYFKKYGLRHFEPLQIWHIPEFYDRFKKETGRAPQPILYPPFPVRVKRSLVQGVRKQLARIMH